MVMYLVWSFPHLRRCGLPGTTQVLMMTILGLLIGLVVEVLMVGVVICHPHSPVGSVRFELSTNENTGLGTAFELLTPIKHSHPSVSWSDILQMASAIAIEVAGGPVITLRFGRVDVVTPAMCQPSGPLPSATGPWKLLPGDHLREVLPLLALRLTPLGLLPNGLHGQRDCGAQRCSHSRQSAPREERIGEAHHAPYFSWCLSPWWRKAGTRQRSWHPFPY
jgi:hypothetical protein